MRQGRTFQASYGGSPGFYRDLIALNGAD